ncbi:hypothetical protein LZ31DRAFT_370348 [Colletotrichum somersetense]|nr:hypothetical protein LZ31DRAFT_370348 [Colletotrichum somersetense]
MTAIIDTTSGTHARRVYRHSQARRALAELPGPSLFCTRCTTPRPGSGDDMDSFGGHRGTALDSTPMTSPSRYMFSSNKPSGRFSGEGSTRHPGTKQPGPFVFHQLSPSPLTVGIVSAPGQAGAKVDWFQMTGYVQRETPILAVAEQEVGFDGPFIP